MPTITVYRHDLNQLAGQPPDWPLAELDERLALVKGELGGRKLEGTVLRTSGGQWVEDDRNHALRIELKDTNRPDLWSVEGIARQLRDHARGDGRHYPFLGQTEPGELHIEVDPALRSIRPFIGGFLAHGAVIDEVALLAFIETQETLTRNFGRKRKTISIGLYNGEGVVFPVQFRAVARHEFPFVPLPPAVGRETWQGGVALTPEEILTRHPTGQEYAGVLAGFDRVPLLTDAQGEVLSLIPIINSAGLGRVTPGSNSLFVEITGIELDQCLLALNILATNLADRGWSIIPVTTDYPYETPRGRTIIVPCPMAITQHVPVCEFARLLGESSTGAEIVSKLRAYGVVAHEEPEGVVATILSYRQDYLHAVDVIEDYAISRGYDAISATMQQEFTVGHLDPLTELEDLARDLVIGFGFEEAICNILTSGDAIRRWMNVNLEQGVLPFHSGPTVRIDNVMNQNYAQLRDWVIPSLMEIEAHSAGAVYPHRIFEVGEVAVYDSAANLGSCTESRLAAIIADESASFDSAQSVIYALLGSLGIAFQVQAWQHPAFIEGRVALVSTKPSRNGEAIKLGFLGELSPQVLTNWGARVPIAAFELSVDALMAALA